MRFLLFIRYRDTNHLACQRSSGFTLIELLLVISLLAVLAIAAINAFDGNEEQARYNITRLEMVELQKALLQFRKDNREFPCRTFRTGEYNPLQFAVNYGITDFNGDFTLPASNTSQLWQNWCIETYPADENQPAKASYALLMLNEFPYVASDHGALFWNRNTQSGWNGPYISQSALTDGWGEPYLLLNSELDYDQSFYCQQNGTSPQQLNVIDDEYLCLSATAGSLPADYTIKGNIVRIVSTGPNKTLESSTSSYDLVTQNPCEPISGSDDIVLCLLR